MPKVYKVDGDEERHIIYADSVAQVKSWWLDQNAITITSASPKDVFDFYQNHGKPVVLAKGEPVVIDEGEIEKRRQA